MIALLCSLALSATPATAVPVVVDVRPRTYQQAWELSWSAGRPLVVFVSSPVWCPSCRVIAPHWSAWKTSQKSAIPWEMDASDPMSDGGPIPRVSVFRGGRLVSRAIGVDPIRALLYPQK